MENMSSMFNLPNEILCTILISWVDGRALGRLDSATCATVYRPSLLAVLCSEQFICDSMPYINIPTNQHDHCRVWMTRRRVKVRDWCIAELFEPNVLLDLLMVTGGTHVQSLSLAFLSGTELTTALLSLSLHCKNVTKLVMDDCCGWSWALSSMTREAQLALKELSIESCEDARPVDFRGASFPNLQFVFLTSLADNEERALDKAVGGLLVASPNLKELRVNDASTRALLRCMDQPNVKERLRGLQALLVHDEEGMAGPSIQRLGAICSNLQTLYLRAPQPELDAAVQSFLLSGGHLSCLAIDGSLNGSVLTAVAIRCSAQLLYVSLEGAQFSRADDAPFRALAEHCPQLIELELRQCTNMAAKSLIHLLASLRCLRELSITYCTTVTDAVLVAIAEHLPNLETLSLLGCTGFTQDGAYALIHSLHKLRRFGPDRIIFTDLVQKLWRDRLPQLEISEWVLATEHFRDVVG